MIQVGHVILGWLRVVLQAEGQVQLRVSLSLIGTVTQEAVANLCAAQSNARSLTAVKPDLILQGSVATIDADNTRHLLRLTESFLSVLGYEVLLANDGVVALGLARAFDPEIALLDIGVREAVFDHHLVKPIAFDARVPLLEAATPPAQHPSLLFEAARG